MYLVCMARRRRRSYQSWRHGKKSKDWSAAIKKRDTTCALCKAHTNLQAHHILPASLFPEYRYRMWNGISLCQEHHRLLHKNVLDLLLLPDMYKHRSRNKPAYRALIAHEDFAALAAFRGGRCSKKALSAAVTKGRYITLVFKLHPQWARNVFGN